ncbi:MAG TPA: sigma-70 family RNA polymerase sigma factor [Schlesneria sp.]|jgi:RNA polymerase sigma-70 factor (ECF subfamily)
MQDIPQLVDHLFRREAGKMVSHLTRLFGLSRLSLAEDVVQDALCQALQSWSVNGLPDNPSAWLMRVARNRVIDLIRRDSHLSDLTPELTLLLQQREKTLESQSDFEKMIQDDQLRLMFSCCHPELSTEVQLTLILKTLCGFSVAEVASALLANHDSIEKRLARARKLFRESGSLVEVTDAAGLTARLEAVYQAIYLLFNEGYHGSQSETTIREDLCYEALRLALLLCEHAQGARPRTFALVALFCFNAARLPGRVDAEGFLIQLESQDRSTWDQELIAQGFVYLERSAAGNELSEYHLEAAIACLHSGAETYANTDWSRILELYDLLFQLKPTPIVALNRAIAAGYSRGPDEGLRELESITELSKLKDYPFYPAAQGEFHRLAGRFAKARACFQTALDLARNPAETELLSRKLAMCEAAC